ncbi:D-amino-acid oxidase [Pleurostoma richardsiae]|uniref:D-amino-acid oxidase n=1 Tax=Pleurostoma richardsiae TaxID=41990 RepID=A0AA38VJC9_9PEZI|nr:D-amino-acid oxidase [Pleurostoma richardsiae]
MHPRNTTFSHERPPFAQQPVVILGAGIIGCATAHGLLSKGYSVMLVGEFLPGDRNIYYASNWAGAAWHAGPNLSSEHKQLQATTYRYLFKMVKDGPESGVCVVDCVEYFREKPGPDSALWGKNVVGSQNQCRLQLPPGSQYQEAWWSKTLVTDPTKHMPYISGRIGSMGGKFIRHRVASLAELYDMFPQSTVFINASGIGSRELKDVQDMSCFPERGRDYTYVIPRPYSGGVILGGVKQPHILDEEPDMKIAAEEIARTHALVPEVVPAKPREADLEYIVGIRPQREGGFRIARQDLGERVVISAYGFGGNGFAFSYGVADTVVKMVEQVELERVCVPFEGVDGTATRACL